MTTLVLALPCHSQAYILSPAMISPHYIEYCSYPSVLAVNKDNKGQLKEYLSMTPIGRLMAGLPKLLVSVLLTGCC